MDYGLMEKIETFKKQIKVMEECLNNNKPCFDEMDLYHIKKQMLEFKLENPKNIEIDILLQLMDNLDTAFDKDQSEKMNHKLNLLTVGSTNLLPISFYTGMRGMNFEDVP